MIRLFRKLGCSIGMVMKRFFMRNDKVINVRVFVCCFALIYIFSVSNYIVRNFSGFMNQTGHIEKTGNEIARAYELDEVIDKYETEIERGDYQSALKIIDDNIATTDDLYEKCILYVAKANIEYNLGHYEKSLEYINQGLAYDKNDATYDFKARVQVVLGDYNGAIESYKKAIRTVDFSKPVANEMIGYYESKIRGLSHGNK